MTPMRIITWNVNSIRVREERLVALLERHKPTVLCLQELKLTDEKFPHEAVSAAGYSAETFGQPTYNGVAILTPHGTEMTDVVRGFSDSEEEDEQARLIAATVQGVRVVNGYMVNGKEVGSDKWDYKLRWLDRLENRIKQEIKSYDELVLTGDFNIAPFDHDAKNIEKWSSSVLCHPDSRARYEAFLAAGLVDVFRKYHPDGNVFTWWDYRQLAFPKNDGLRIDMALTTQELAEKCVDARVDRDERKGKQPSDHAPVLFDFEL